MHRVLRTLALRSLGLAGVFPTALTEPAPVQALIRDLAPVIPPRELIRLGPEGDGGYLIPDDLDGIAACFSPGVSLVSGFERACADRGMKVFLADGSVDRPGESHRLFHFTQRFVGAWTEADSMTLDFWVDHSQPGTEDLLLQMDIEGAEYETILGISDALMRRFRILVIEFHHLNHLWSRPFFNLASRALRKMLATHRCVHIHPNNTAEVVRRGAIEIPGVAEFTFLRKDRLPEARPATTFPHPLDRDNVRDFPAIALPRCWYVRD